ncbi:MAG: O-antigen ligase family protein [Pyrinomonadaceae bacterium]
MRNFFEWLDRLAGIGKDSRAVAWLERAAFVFLTLTVISAPHSIAATQTAWIIGMLAWIVRLFFKPRVRFRFGLLDAALWGLFLWSVVSSLVSYEPAVSLDRLRGAAVFLIFYFVFFNVRTRRAAAFLAVAMIGSTIVNAVWMPVERLIGRGVELIEPAPNSPLAKARLLHGDTLLQVNGRRVATPDDVLAAIESEETSRVKFYRPDFEYVVEVNRADLLPGDTALERLGLAGWKKSHNWRSKGFYGHYTTYAEVLQLIGSLAFGLLVAAFARRRKSVSNRSISNISFIALVLAVAAIGFALLLTVTRAPQLAFIISAGLIVLVGLGRKWFATALFILVPVALGGLIFLQQSRKVDFFDRSDESTQYRQMMTRDGLRLWTENPRHFVFGVGMDSIQRHWREWGLYDRGWQPMGHFHSTPIQLLVERGLPALLLWLMILGVYARTLWKGLKEKIATDWTSKGILLGCLGGLAGFVVSGLVHYNLGDQEVAMVFFILMGFGVRVSREDAAWINPRSQPAVRER